MAGPCISIFVNSSSPENFTSNRNKSNDGTFKLNQRAPRKFLRVGNIPPLHGEEEHLCQNYDQYCNERSARTLMFRTRIEHYEETTITV